jgi:PAS domain S-box-containing protein
VEKQNTAETIKQLQGCISDLTSVLALPALWTGNEPSQIITTLLDGVVGMLRLDFAYARLGNGRPIEFLRLAQGKTPVTSPDTIGEVLKSWLSGDSKTSPLSIPNPIGTGQVNIGPLPLGFHGEIGVVVAASTRRDFPTKTETLLLRVAANQAALGLQEARLYSEQRIAAVELEQKVEERTRQLTAVNEELIREVTERERAESNLLVLKDELAAELSAMTNLHELSTRLLVTTELQLLLENVLDATIALLNAQYGNIQLYNPKTKGLEIVAQRGFDHDFLDHFSTVDDDGAACGRAISLGRRVVIEDVLTDPGFARHRAIAAAAGFRAVQSTPMFSRSGAPLGMISTHFREPHRPQARELRMTDLYARLAADLIDRQQAEEALRESEEKYRTLFESIDEGFCTIEVLFDGNDKAIDFRLLETNPSFEKQAGITEVLGRRAREKVPGLEDYWFETFGKIAITGEPANFENQVEELQRWYDVYGWRVGEPQERKVAILFSDITERKHSEEALRASEERFRRYFDLGLIGMAITSPDKGCLEVNDELCRILGYDRNELLQMSLDQITHPDDLAADVEQFERVTAGVIDGYRIDKRWIRKDGRIIDSIMAARCVRRLDGSVDYFVGLVQDITERKQAEEVIRSTHERLDLILNSITDQFFSLSKDWRFNYINRQASEQMKQLGKNPEKLIGKVLWDEFSEVPNEEALRRVMDERVVINDELYYAPLGEWVENHMYPTSDGGLVAFQKYVTNRKLAQKALLESERRFSVMFDKAAFAIALTRLPDGFIVDVNQAWMKLYGFNREEVIGKTSLELGINRDLTERKTLFAEIKRHGSVRNREMTFHTKAGAARLISCNMDVVAFGGNEYLLSTMHDVTELRRAEEQRRRSEAYLTEGQRLSHTGSWAWNAATGEHYWSDEHYRIFGLDPEKFELTIEAAREFIHPEDQPVANQAFDKAIGEGSEFDLNFRIVRPGGTVRYVHSQAHPVFDDAGEVTEYVGTIMDITQRKLSEEALRQAHAELAHASRVLTVGELTASIAHEVNQPLGAIVTNGNASLRLISRDPPDIEGAREAVDCMIADAMRASQVIVRIRALLKKSTPEMAPLNLNWSIQDVLEFTAGELARNQVLLTTELATDLAPVLGDRIQLQQVLLNIILNGAEAMSAPDWQPRELMVTSSMSNSGELMVAVSDTGHGLHSLTAENIFDPFVSTKEGGLGLGLSISRTIIESHGGRLWATSKAGHGTTFQFTLPASGHIQH